MQNRSNEVITLIDIEIDVLVKSMQIYIDKMPDKLDVINKYYTKIEDLRRVKRHIKQLIKKYECITTI